MLPDPLTVKSPSLGGSTALTLDATESFAITDVSPGRTVRVATMQNGGLASLPATLTISHTVSNENRPSKTDRHLIRLDVRTVADTQGSREVTASTYLVIAVPRGAYRSVGGDPFDDECILDMLNTLFGVIFTGSSAATLDGGAKFTRLMAGEP